MSSTSQAAPQTTPPDPLMGFSGTPSENIRQEDRLKIAIVGDFKQGKSWLAATAPKPVYIFDFDDRAESLAGKSGLIIAQKPSMELVERTLSIAKANKIQGKKNPATWVFDSVTYMNRAMEDEIFRQTTGLYREIKVGNSRSMKIRSGWDAINGIQRYMEYLVSEFSPLGNIIFVYHEKNEKDAVHSTKDETKYTGDITVDPQYLAKSLSLFNEVFRISFDNISKFVVQCRQSYNFAASTTLHLDKEEAPNLMDMIRKHQEARAKAAANNKA